MSSKTTHTYDSLGRLTSAQLPNGVSTTYSYDELGNRQTVVEIPPLTPPAPSLITIASLPKKLFGDFKNNPMMVLLSSGELIGWGNNSAGGLANGLSTNTTSIAQRLMFDPNTTSPASGTTIVDWAFTNANIYIVYSNGWVYSAGANDYGQLAQGDTTERDQLKRIEYFVTNSISINKVWAAASVYATNGGGCAYFLSSAGNLYGCGANAAGNLANNTTTNQSTPVTCLGLTGLSGSPTISDLQMSSDDANFACYLLMSNGTVMVAGANTVGQLGINTTTNRSASFTNALKFNGTSNVNLTNVVSISANGGFAGGSSVAANALAVDSSGNVWTVGNNVYGILGLGSTTSESVFYQVTALSNVAQAGLGGGYYGCGYAITTSGALYTWGYGGNNSLFQNNTTTRVETPTLATYIPGTSSKIYFPRGENLTTSAMQLFALTTAGKIVYAGAANGQIGLNNAVTSGAYYYIPSPLQILNGTETIDDVFVHGTSTAQRIFVLTSAGNLYACGLHANSICTGGIASDAAVASTAWYKISFMP
jgi:YD repeat-containing protein